MYKGFISYSHADLEICAALQQALAPLRQEIRFWWDRNLQAGDRWRPQIAYHLKRSQVAIILASPDAFRQDGFLMTKELPNAEVLWKAERLAVLTATARPVSLGGHFLSKTELCPDKGRTLPSGYDQIALDAWCADVAAAVARRLSSGHGPPAAAHHETVRLALEEMRRRVGELLDLLVLADTDIGDEASFELVSAVHGVLAALASPVADLRSDVEAVTVALERVADQHPLIGDGAEAMLTVLLELGRLNDLLSDTKYPLPPDHVPARVRPRAKSAEAEPVTLGESLHAVEEELPYVRQHGDPGRDAADHIAAKLQVGRALMTGGATDALGVRKVLSDIQEQASALADACLDPETNAPALADNALRLCAAATPAERALAPGVVFQDVSFAPMMVVVPAGDFQMGAASNDPLAYRDERPRHAVRISSPFAIGVYPVTVAEWRAFEAATGRQVTMPNTRDGEQAVGGVTWFEATAYCDWLSRICNASYRLPSEAEWEYACRAGTDKPYWFGERMRGSNGAFGGGASPRVGRYRSNPFGLHDVHGTIWEWCLDSWHASYVGAPVDGSPWQAEGVNRRVARGGSFKSSARHARASNRYGEEAGNVLSDIGLRVVRSVKELAGR